MNCVLPKDGLVAKLCVTLCDPMDCSLPGSTVHGISQARILEWAAISFYLPKDAEVLTWLVEPNLPENVTLFGNKVFVYIIAYVIS